MNNKHLSIIFYTAWIVIQVLQASFTKLHPDEAYYWMYSQQLDWGYFDHPPMIAAFIKIGYFLFKYELGVRLISILTGVASIYIWEKIIEPKKLLNYYIIVCSFGFLHFITFVATPDTPLLFFSSLFVIAFKRYLVNKSLWITLALGVLSALMLWSKYHAILILGFMFLIHIKALKEFKFWLLIFVIILLFTPHVIWQYYNGFPSFIYHLSDRNEIQYKFINTISFFISQPFVYAPFAGLLGTYALYKYQTINQFEKSLKTLIIGVFLFFLFMTFKGRVEAHWTIILMFPLIYFTIKIIEKNERLERFINKSWYLFLLIILIARLFLTIDSQLMNKYFPLVYSNWHQEYKNVIQINKISNDNPVVFLNSFQKASLYNFYTANEATSITYLAGRKNQYSIWEKEQQYIGKEVVVIPNWNSNKLDSIVVNGEKINYWTITDFYFTRGFNVEILDEVDTLYSGKVQELIINVSSNEIIKSNNKLYLQYQFINDKGVIISNDICLKFNQNHLNKPLSVKINSPKEKNNYQLSFGVRSGNIPPLICSEKYNVIVK